MLQKVQFVASVIHEPDLLILDEPFSGLDPVSARLLKDLILAEHRRGATILFSTHVMPQAEEICRHVVMIHQGRKVLDENLAGIRRRYDPRALHFEPLDPDGDVLPALAAVGSVERVERSASGYDILLAEGTDPAAAIRQVAAAAAPARIELSRPRLEDVFVQIVSGEGTSWETAQKLKDELGATPAVAV
jgi:ABC-2 type transport system ATP-binding protein